MKKKILALILTAALILCFAACSASKEVKNEAPVGTPAQSVQDEPVESAAPVKPDTEDDIDGSIKSGSHTLPCGMKIQFSQTVRNDITGNWRLSTTADSYVPADYALEYYTEMFSSDDEIHEIWNATLETTTRISAAGGILFVDTLEYVKGEEHDAKIMFSGTVLDSKIIDIATGKEIEE